MSVNLFPFFLRFYLPFGATRKEVQQWHLSVKCIMEITRLQMISMCESCWITLAQWEVNWISGKGLPIAGKCCIEILHVIELYTRLKDPPTKKIINKWNTLYTHSFPPFFFNTKLTLFLLYADQSWQVLLNTRSITQCTSI